MPWHRPAEFGALAWSPIAMVGQPTLDAFQCLSFHLVVVGQARFVVITVPSFYYGTLFAW